MVRALRDEGKRWLNMDLDAAHVLRHCSLCLATSTRGEKVVPPHGAPWIMLLLVEFATNRLCAFDLDIDKEGVGFVAM